jgi:hypothetical protein
MPTDQLRPDQPEVLAYEGYHRHSQYDYEWYVDPVTRVGAHVYVECFPGLKPRAYVKNAYLLELPSLIRLTHLQTCAARFMAGEIEKRDNESAARVAEQTAADNLAARTRMVVQDAPDVTDSPAPHGCGTSQDASGV